MDENSLFRHDEQTVKIELGEENWLMLAAVRGAILNSKYRVLLYFHHPILKRPKMLRHSQVMRNVQQMNTMVDSYFLKRDFPKLIEVWYRLRSTFLIER